MPLIQPQAASVEAPEKYLIAFVIQGDDVFKITADNIIHTTGTASGPAFDAIAKLKAAAALLELTNRHKERPDELRQMARELAGEGMKLMARASSDIQSAPLAAAPLESAPESATDENIEVLELSAERTAVTEAMPRVEAVRVAPPTTARGLAPVPRPEERSADAAALPGNSPSNSKIALISG